MFTAVARVFDSDTDCDSDSDGEADMGMDPVVNALHSLAAAFEPDGGLMALTQQAILEKLHEIQAPGGRMSLVEAGAVRGIDVEDDGSVKVVLAVEATDPTVASEVRKAVEEALAALDDDAE